jgi:hypothetical protein
MQGIGNGFQSIMRALHGFRVRFANPGRIYLFVGDITTQASGKWDKESSDDLAFFVPGGLLCLPQRHVLVVRNRPRGI